MPAPPRRAFDTFVLSPGNRFAHAAATGVTERPGSLYNPLVIHGPSGSGKSHLLSAIAERMTLESPATTAKWFTGQSFADTFISGVRAGEIRRFTGSLASADLVLVDDLHELAREQPVLSPLRVCLAAVCRAGHQAVLAATGDLSDLNDFARTLRKEQPRCLLVDIEPIGLQLVWSSPRTRSSTRSHPG